LEDITLLLSPDLPNTNAILHLIWGLIDEEDDTLTLPSESSSLWPRERPLSARLRPSRAKCSLPRPGGHGTAAPAANPVAGLRRRLWTMTAARAAPAQRPGSRSREGVMRKRDRHGNGAIGTKSFARNRYAPRYAPLEPLEKP
jgi:hypothetical protein